MTWTDPKTWVNDEVLTAEDLNTQLSSNLSHLHMALRQYTRLCDEKNAGTHGGSFASGAWRTRDLNVRLGDPGGFVSLSSNSFTLAAGTYYLCAQAPAFTVDGHQVRLQNISLNQTLALGSNAVAAASGGEVTWSNVQALVQLSSASIIELQHRCVSTSINSRGFGQALNFGPEVYSIVEIWKLD